MHHKKCAERRKRYECPCSFFASTFSLYSCSHLFTPPSYHPPSWMLNGGKSVQGDKCGWIHSYHQEPSALIRPDVRGPQWSSDLWPLELIEANDLMRWSYEGGRVVLKWGVDKKQMSQQSQGARFYCIGQHFLLREFTGECTWMSFGINIYAIQNDIKKRSWS